MINYKLAPHWTCPSAFYRERPQYFSFRWVAILVGKWMMWNDPVIHCFKVLSRKPLDGYFQPRYPEYASCKYGEH